MENAHKPRGIPDQVRDDNAQGGLSSPNFCIMLFGVVSRLRRIKIRFLTGASMLFPFLQQYNFRNHSFWQITLKNVVVIPDPDPASPKNGY